MCKRLAQIIVSEPGCLARFDFWSAVGRNQSFASCGDGDLAALFYHYFRTAAFIWVAPFFIGSARRPCSEVLLAV